MTAINTITWLILLITSTMVKTDYSFIMTANTQDDVLAFTLGLKDHFHDINGSIMDFNKVIYVSGLSSEFQTSGVFTCPANGVYKFQVHALTVNDKRLWLELYKNEELVASLYGYTPKNYATAANAVVLFLKEEDRIFVKTRDQYDVMLFGKPDEIYATFSGVRMSNCGVAASNGNMYDVSFSATLTTHMVVNQGSTISYNKVILNQGNGYNNYTGIFTAPVNGIYIFHFFTLSDKDTKLWQELYHNSDYVCALYGYTPTEYAAAGNTAILNLRLGDDVQVKARETNKLYGQPDQVYSIFSGALISRELPNVPLSSRMIAFSVGLSASTVVSANSKVRFDQIFINVKHTYDQRTGDFTAPIDGSYEFNVHALGQMGFPIWLELFHNYKYIVSLYSSVPDGYGSTSNSAVIRLYTDDVVYVKTRYNKNAALYGHPDGIFCTFSGHLLTSTT